MSFDLTDEQRLLQDSVNRLIADRYGFDQRRQHQTSPEGWSREMWRRFAELGLLGLPFGEEWGGHGGGPMDVGLVMEAFGRGLVLEPYLATVVLAGGVIRRAGSAAMKGRIVPRIADGSLLLALAHGEPQARYDLADVATAARPCPGGWALTGGKTTVIHGDCAEQIVVSARTAGAQREADGISLFLVDAQMPGLSRRPFMTQDGMRAAHLTLDGVVLGQDRLIGAVGGGLPVIRRVVEEGIAAVCAEAVGLMQAMLDITVDYLKTRHQFGVPIGSFQVLQHRAVDMLVALDQARSMALYAAMMAEDEDAAERAKAISAAKVQIGRSARLVGQQAIQLHGGIGLTMEYAVGHYFLRSTVIELLFGDADHHLAALARAGGLIDAAG